MPARPPRHIARKTPIAQLVAQLFVGGAMLGAAMPASAVSCTWNPASGNWAAIANWLTCATGNGNPVGTPGAADSATIAVAKTVTINTGQSILALNNAGTINIDAFGLNLVGGGSTTNAGTINVGGASTANMGVSGGHNMTNTGGTINIAAGSVINQFGSTITGGTIAGAGALVGFASASNFLNGVTLNGTLDLATNGGIERITNGLTLGGTISLNNNGVLAFQDTNIVSGNGTIVLGNTGSSNRIALDGNGTTTLAAGTTIRGENGTIGAAVFVGGTQALVNNGTITADVAGGLVNINTVPVTNNGTLSALNGGTLQLSSNVTGNPGGQIVAGAGSTVLQNGVTLAGTINTSGSGRFAATASGTNFLSGVTLNGNLDLATATGFDRVTAGGLVLNGTINLNNNSVLTFEGNGGLSGNATIVLGNTGSSNRIALDGNGTTMLSAGTTIRGHSGTIGNAVFVGGTQTLVNNGTINTDVAGGTITISGAALNNNGLVRAQAGTITVASALSGSGTLQVDATGVMNLANGAKTQGILAMGATGAAINLNTGNLTLNTDYTNVGAGTGNAFNRRAGVTGAGLIVAGGNAAQAVTGADVTNGNTANATLTLGNVRVGATTFNYQVANTGTTGPSLRGAIQTNVNGGNLTDARLSGTGVTASNYNTGAPGSNTGNLAVTFNAAGPGLLAPMSGQVLNLRSTFDNIADQKLNIVLAAGATAFNVAGGNANPSPAMVANQRVGGSNFTTLTVTNSQVPSVFTEDLNATFGASTGAASGSGSITGRLAGAANSNTGIGAMTVAVNTATAGAKTGTVTLNYQTAGAVNGVSNGLGTASTGSQTITVNGAVFQTATGAVQSAPLNFGTVQVGQSVSQSLVIRNTATGAAGFVEDLNASFGSASGTGASLISGSGSLSGILAGTNSTGANGSMLVSVNTTAAGTVAGNIAVNYATAGAVGGVSNGLGTAAAGSEAYGVNGVINAVANVINQASPQINNPTINLGAVRVGAASPNANVSITNVATVAPQAALNASIASNGAPITAAGSFNLLNPGATNTASLQVGLNTATAGNFTGGNAGSATISFVSDANNVGNCAPNCQLSIASQIVNVSGKVYSAAVGLLNTAAVNFGIVRVGDVVASQNIGVQNTAAATALNDSLRANLSGVGGAFTGGNTVGGVAAGGSGNITVGLNTSAAGIFSQNGTVSFLSQNADMADVSAGANAPVTVTAQVNNHANGAFSLVSGLGALTLVGTDWVLDLGNVALNSNVSDTLKLKNDTTGPADDLSGVFDLALVDDFIASGFGPVSGLGAGQSSGNLNLNFAALSLGLFQDIIDFDGFGTNASDPTGVAQSRRLIIRANVFNATNQVPEPGTLALLLVAAAAAVMARRRRSMAK